MDTNFREGDRIKCINRPDSGKNGNFGKLGKVTEVDSDGTVFVEYDDGNTGYTTHPERYYQKVTYSGYKAGSTKVVSGTTRRQSNNMIEGAINAVKRMTLTTDDKKLIRVGFMTECGLYTEEAQTVVNQDACAAARTRLLAVADSIIADRKDAKEDAE